MIADTLSHCGALPFQCYTALVGRSRDFIYLLRRKEKQEKHGAMNLRRGNFSAARPSRLIFEKNVGYADHPIQLKARSSTREHFQARGRGIEGAILVPPAANPQQ